MLLERGEIRLKLDDKDKENLKQVLFRISIRDFYISVMKRIKKIKM
jgi:hypothetical protein